MRNQNAKTLQKIWCFGICACCKQCKIKTSISVIGICALKKILSWMSYHYDRFHSPTCALLEILCLQAYRHLCTVSIPFYSHDSPYNERTNSVRPLYQAFHYVRIFESVVESIYCYWMPLPIALARS